MSSEPDVVPLPSSDPSRLLISLDPSATRFLGAGWSHAEPQARWMTGAESTMMLDPSPFQGDCTLYLDLMPIAGSRPLPPQRLDILVNGHEIGRFALGHAQRRTLVCEVPEAAIAGKAAVSIVFRHPDGATPASVISGSHDGRHLCFYLYDLFLQDRTAAHLARHHDLRNALSQPIARSAATRGEGDRLTDAELAVAFESLGNDCELGFVQRQMGAEPIGFLRFAGMPLIHFVRGVRSSFEGLAEEASFRINTDVYAELIGVDDRYKLEYHTAKYRPDADPVLLRPSEMLRQKYLAKKLIEDLEDAEKIFVVKDKLGLPGDYLLLLLDAVRSRGPGVVLWVDLADEGHPSGSAEIILPGLMKGYLDRFANLPEGPHTTSLDSWRNMLDNAHALWDLARP